MKLTTLEQKLIELAKIAKEAGFVIRKLPSGMFLSVGGNLMCDACYHEQCVWQQLTESYDAIIPLIQKQSVFIRSRIHDVLMDLLEHPQTFQALDAAPPPRTTLRSTASSN